jgi:hypothetical protein
MRRKAAVSTGDASQFIAPKRFGKYTHTKNAAILDIDFEREKTACESLDTKIANRDCLILDFMRLM